MSSDHRSERALDWQPASKDRGLTIARAGYVAVVRLDRPETRNALSTQLLTDLVVLLETLDEADDTRAIVISGGERVFASGADITEMVGVSAIEMYRRPRLTLWHRLRRVGAPLVAAVNGYALGGGNELAMVCDIIIAGENAVFGQPEVGLGIVPGGGGTQRLVRAVGKSTAMDIILSGRTLDAREALAAGLVSRVVPVELCLDVAIEVGQTIADRPSYAARLAKQAVLAADDLSLEQGLDLERRHFELAISTADAQEGLTAFRDKRPPRFTGQ